MRPQADIDMPLPIGYGQTNSQPSTVRRMLEWLDARAGERILDVGSGSGWTTALLATLVGPTGSTYAVEKVPELVKFGRENCRRSSVHNATFFPAGVTYGLPEYAPYDRILVSAAARELPYDLLRQLKVGGKIVMPINDTIVEITENKGDDMNIVEHPGFAFVPLV